MNDNADLVGILTSGLEKDSMEAWTECYRRYQVASGQPGTRIAENWQQEGYCIDIPKA